MLMIGGMLLGGVRKLYYVRNCTCGCSGIRRRVGPREGTECLRKEERGARRRSRSHEAGRLRMQGIRGNGGFPCQVYGSCGCEYCIVNEGRDRLYGDGRYGQGWYDMGPGRYDGNVWLLNEELREVMGMYGKVEEILSGMRMEGEYSTETLETQNADGMVELSEEEGVRVRCVGGLLGKIYFHIERACQYGRRLEGGRG